jgi:hypothetical protein
MVIDPGIMILERIEKEGWRVVRKLTEDERAYAIDRLLKEDYVFYEKEQESGNELDMDKVEK